MKKQPSKLVKPIKPEYPKLHKESRLSTSTWDSPNVVALKQYNKELAQYEKDLYIYEQTKMILDIQRSRVGLILAKYNITKK